MPSSSKNSSTDLFATVINAMLSMHIGASSRLTASIPFILMSASTEKLPPNKIGVLWDVDGTLVESTALAFEATNEVLTAQGREPVTVEEYKIGCKYHKD